MKNFTKILITFLLVFSIGIFITYKSINHTFKKLDKEHLVNSYSNTIFNKTILIS